MKTKRDVGLIYCAFNKITGMYYVGATTLGMQQRKIGHYTVRKKYKFQIALAESKKEDWEWTVLEREIPLKQLHDREAFWMKEKDSVNNGYNLRKGRRDLDLIHLYHGYSGEFNGTIIDAMKWMKCKSKQPLFDLLSGKIKAHKWVVLYENKDKTFYNDGKQIYPFVSRIVNQT